MELFKGACTAIITPFTDDNKIDFLTLEKLINFQLKNNISAIVFLGTTGEASTLTFKEKIDITKFAIKKINGKVPVIIGAGGNNTSTAIELSQEFKKHNADALLHVTPYYNKCTQEGLFYHYKTIANSVNIPIILYNVPSRTNVNISPETVLSLSSISNIIGIKEASGNLDQLTTLFSILPKNFSVYSGEDANIFSTLALGGKGVISVVSNIFPKETSDLCNYFFEKNYKKAKEIQFNLLPIIKQLFSEVNPIPIKYALKIQGYGNGKLRLPLTTLTDKNIKILKNLLKNNYFCNKNN